MVFLVDGRGRQHHIPFLMVDLLDELADVDCAKAEAPEWLVLGTPWAEMIIKISQTQGRYDCDPQTVGLKPTERNSFS